MNMTEETWEANMLSAVNENHRRAIEMANEHRKPERPAMPLWACILWVTIMAAVAAACLVYAAW